MKQFDKIALRFRAKLLAEAIEEAANEGRAVTIPAGTYGLDAPINLRRSDK